MKNIIQMECFHVGGKDVRSLKQLFTQMKERVESGLALAARGIETPNGIKTVVRFYDSGAITAKVLKYVRLEKKEEKRWQTFLSTSGIRREIAGYRYHRLAVKTGRKRQSLFSLIVREFASQVSKREEVAVETFGHSFRLARKEELHELQEAARVAKGFWIFLFKPNNLLADRNEIVASVM